MLDRMYLFKQDTFRDGVIDTKDIDQWRQILHEYEETLNKITTPKKQRKHRFNKDLRTDKSITTTEEVIIINPPFYQCNKKKNHCILNI